MKVYNQIIWISSNLNRIQMNVFNLITLILSLS